MDPREEKGTWLFWPGLETYSGHDHQSSVLEGIARLRIFDGVDQPQTITDFENEHEFFHHEFHPAPENRAEVKALEILLETLVILQHPVCPEFFLRA